MNPIDTNLYKIVDCFEYRKIRSPLTKNFKHTVFRNGIREMIIYKDKDKITKKSHLSPLAEVLFRWCDKVFKTDLINSYIPAQLEQYGYINLINMALNHLNKRIDPIPSPSAKAKKFVILEKHLKEDENVV